jgi:hypothetical protein
VTPGEVWQIACEQDVVHSVLVVPAPRGGDGFHALYRGADRPGVGSTPRRAVLHIAHLLGAPVVSLHGPCDHQPGALENRVEELKATVAHQTAQLLRVCQANADLGALATFRILLARDLAEALAAGGGTPEGAAAEAHAAADGTWVGLDTEGRPHAAASPERVRELLAERRFVLWLWLLSDRTLIPPPVRAADGGAR